MEIDEDKICELYESGFSYKEIGEQLGCSTTTAWRVAKKHGVVSRNQGTRNDPEWLIEDVKHMFNIEGMTIAQISNELDLTEYKVRKIIKLYVEGRKPVENTLKAERNEQIYLMHTQGMTARAIADEFSISHQRVNQIIHRYRGRNDESAQAESD